MCFERNILTYTNLQNFQICYAKTLPRLSWLTISCYMIKFRVLWLVSRMDVLIMKTTIKTARRFLSALPEAFVQIESQNRDIYEQRDKRTEGQRCSNVFYNAIIWFSWALSRERESLWFCLAFKYQECLSSFVSTYAGKLAIKHTWILAIAIFIFYD